MPTAGELTIVIEAQDRASAQLRELGQGLQRLERQAEGVRRSSAGGFLGGLNVGAGIRAAEAGFQAVGGLVDFLQQSIFGLNADLERSVTTFQALTGSAARAQEMIGALRREAAATPFSDAEVIAAGRALITSAEGSTDALLGLVRVAEQLAAVDPAQGLEGAATALREALGGDFESLIQRFEVSRQSIARFRAEGLSNLQVVTRALQEMGVGAELVERLGRTFEGRAGTVRSFFDELRRSLGEGIFQRVSDLFGHMVNLIAEHGDRLLRVARDLGQTFGALLERLAAAATGPLQALLDAFAPGLWSAVATELERTVEPVQEIERAAKAAAPAARDLNRELAGIGVEAATVQLEANRVKQSYDAQIAPLERQLRLLQQSADLQRVQNALATNRAAVEGLRLDREIAALQAAAGSAIDPNQAGLTTRQRLIALALQERTLRREELGLQEQQRPAVQSVAQQLEALHEQQRRALEPLEAQLQTHRNNADALQLEIKRTEELKAANQAATEAARRVGTGPAAPEAVEDARKRGEALAESWLQGWAQWIEKGGGTLGGAIAKSLDDWYQTTGKPRAERLGADLGTAIGTAIGQNIGPTLQAEVEKNPLLQWIQDQLRGRQGAGGGAAGGADLSPAVRGRSGLPPALPRVSPEGAGIGPNALTGGGPNVTVNLPQVTVQLSEEDRQARIDELTDSVGREVATAIVDALVQAQAQTDPGPNRLVQGNTR